MYLICYKVFQKGIQRFSTSVLTVSNYLQRVVLNAIVQGKKKIFFWNRQLKDTRERESNWVFKRVIFQNSNTSRILSPFRKQQLYFSIVTFLNHPQWVTGSIFTIDPVFRGGMPFPLWLLLATLLVICLPNSWFWQLKQTLLKGLVGPAVYVPLLC